jgi:hypothetical protein
MSRTTKALLIGLAVFVALGGLATFQVRTRMSAARLGSDVSYTIDSKGDAQVEVLEKTYFVDAETERNYDGLVARVGKPDLETFRSGIEKNVQNVAERTGRSGMTVTDFQARFEKKAEYGGRIYSFRWTAFAEKKDGSSVVDFRRTDEMKLTKDSSLTIVLPAGATLVNVVPAPTGPSSGTKLVWSGEGSMPWPYVEYR